MNDSPDTAADREGAPQMRDIAPLETVSYHGGAVITWVVVILLLWTLAGVVVMEVAP